MKLVVAANPGRLERIKTFVEKLDLGVDCFAFQTELQRALRHCQESSHSLLLLDFSFLSDPDFAQLWLQSSELRELAVCCVGKEEELHLLPESRRERAPFFLPLFDLPEREEIFQDITHIILENYLSQVCSGTPESQLERVASLLGLNKRGTAVAAMYIGIRQSSLPITARELEGLLREAGYENNCFVPKNDDWIGLIINAPTGHAGAEELCSQLRRRIKAVCGDGVVISICLSPCTREPTRLPCILSQAESVAFYQVYDGNDKNYIAWDSRDYFSGSRRYEFREIEHFEELNRAIDQLDSQMFVIALRHMFDDIISCRLDRDDLRQVLFKLMSLIFNVGISNNIPVDIWADNSCAALNFEFVYHIENIEVEYKSFLDIFLRILQYLRERQQNLTKYSPKVRKTMRFIEEHYAEHIELATLASLAELSDNYLCPIFKKETGYRIVEYINLVRMENAKRLIQEQQLPAAKIVELVGFTDTAYFCTMFKRFTGKTVTEYRNSIDLD